MADYTGLVRVLGLSAASATLPAQRVASVQAPAEALPWSVRVWIHGRQTRVPPLQAVPSVLPWHLRVSPALTHNNLNLNGQYAISGTVNVLSIPAQRKVRLMHEFTGALEGDVWSDPLTGAYSFTGLSTGPWTVIAYDHTGTFAGLLNTGVIAS